MTDGYAGRTLQAQNMRDTNTGAGATEAFTPDDKAEPQVLQALQRAGVDLRARALEDGPLVPGEPKPGEVVDQRLGDAGALRTGVEVFDAQHHLPATGPRGEPCHKRGEGVAQVHPPGGGGRKAPAQRSLSARAPGRRHRRGTRRLPDRRRASGRPRDGSSRAAGPCARRSQSRSCRP